MCRQNLVSNRSLDQAFAALIRWAQVKMTIEDNSLGDLSSSEKMTTITSEIPIMLSDRPFSCYTPLLSAVKIEYLIIAEI